MVFSTKPNVFAELGRPPCKGSTPGTSTRTDLISYTDDYGENDISLRSYRKEESIDAMVLTNDQANALLRKSLESFGPSSGERIHISTSGKCSFCTAGGQKIELFVREDMKAVVITTVVNRFKHVEVLVKGNCRRQPSSYALMTKMMKYNSLLSRTPGPPCHIGSYEGTMVFFCHVEISILLASATRIHPAIEEFMMKSVEISNDLSNTNVDAGRRRRFKIGNVTTEM